MTAALEGGEWSAARPGRTLPPGKTRCSFYRRLGGPQGRSGQVRKISSPPGFDPQTVQPVASRYTDWATRPTVWIGTGAKFTKVPMMQYGQDPYFLLLSSSNCFRTLCPSTVSVYFVPWCDGPISVPIETAGSSSWVSDSRKADKFRNRVQANNPRIYSAF